MSAKVTLSGLDELRAALRKLPADMAAEAAGVVQAHAESAAAAIRSEYRAHRHSGYLGDHVTVSKQASGVTVAAVVRSNGPHSHLFEFGTQRRTTARGANRGAAAPHPTVVPIAQRERRAMNAELVNIVKRAGFEVSGAI